MPKVTLDMNTFKALASDTRLDILRALDGKRLNLKDICQATNLNKATLHEHLTKLNEAGLVKKFEREGHKWVYYKLTWKGEGLLHPENTRIVVLFSTTIISLIIGIISFITFVKGKIIEKMGSNGAILTTGNDSEGIALDFYNWSIQGSSKLLIDINSRESDFLVSNLHQNTNSIALQTSQVKGEILDNMNNAAQDYYNQKFFDAYQSTFSNSEKITTVVHDSTFQYIAFICIAVSIILLSIAYWRHKKNKNPAIL
jgi:DNA-binding transcriptional ArsR family regulator